MLPDAVPDIFEKLSEGELFAVHRARIASVEHGLIVKMLAAGPRAGEAQERLDHEFRITRTLFGKPGLCVADLKLNSRLGPMLAFRDEGCRSLDKWEMRPLTEDKLITIATALGRALAELHKAGVVHRDVNPANVIASSDLAIIRLIDFSLATAMDDLAVERPGAMADWVTVAYMAPEQSGRMSRQVDHRADLYSLGVMLYELSTGVQPFDDPDPGVVVHRHLTLVPPSPETVNPAVPPVLAATIMQLIRKNPEDRFQTAGDFLGALQSTRRHRVSARMAIPDTLYGREDLLLRLKRTINANMAGQSRLVRIVGPSGSGKSALIAQLVKPALAAGAHCVRGKFDQLDRAQPYSAFIQAFDELLRQILAASPAEVAAWRAQLLDALSPNGQVLLDLLPKYVLLIGPQPKVPALGLNESQIRTELVFRRFVRALARPDAPLILVLDDLQWSDGASRALIELLLSDPDIRNLTILTAYRDNELGPSHPATLLFAALDARAPLAEPEYVPSLAPEDVARLVADTLGETPAVALPLASIISTKTAGNPFFIRQFLLAMARKGLLTHDATEGRWTWDHDASLAEQFTDNVADLVAERIFALPDATQEIVQLAACCGSQFETEVIALATGQTHRSVATLLEPAILSEIVLPEHVERDGSILRYRFQHDRIQQAAHAMLSDTQRGQLHARIGEILLQSSEGRTARLIEITDHLIAGRDHLAPDTGLRLRDLAIEAARRTMMANAYTATLRYLLAAEQCFDLDPWTDEPELAFKIALQRASVAYLQNDIEAARVIIGGLQDKPLPVLDMVGVLELAVLIETSQLNYRKALRIGRQALSLLGQVLPANPSTPRVLVDLMMTKRRVDRLSDADILSLPRMQRPETLAAMRVLVLCSAPAYFCESNLLPMIALKMVRLSLAHGNAPDSSFGYVIYGMLYCAVLGDTHRGLAYGELACKAAVEFGAQTIEGRVLMVFAGFIKHWSSPLGATLPIFLEGADKAISAGDLEYHGYTRYGHASYALMAGQTLSRVSGYLEQHLAAVTHARHEKTQRIITMARASVGRMRALQDDPFALVFDDDENFRLWTEQDDATSLAYYHKYKMLEALMGADFREVLSQARRMKANLNGILSMAYQPFFQFYEALALIELAQDQPWPKRHSLLARARFITRRLARWSCASPDTLAHRVALLRAELSSAAGDWTAAIKGFDLAATEARRAGALHDAGLFLERSALFYRRRGANDLARDRLIAACRSHAQWGADGWINALCARHPDLSGQMKADEVRGLPLKTTPMPSVDGGTLVRAAAAIAQSATLDEMVLDILGAIVVNTGATRGCLLLEDDGALRLLAEIDGIGQVGPKTGRSTQAAKGLPQRVLNYVRNVSGRVVLEDAQTDQTFGSDPYIASAAPLSILCAPLMLKGDLIGIVYLENTLVRGAFTAERCNTVEVLGAQAGVSVQNARLLQQLRGTLERQVDLTSAHARFVPQAFLEILKRPSITDVRLGDYVTGEASILFLDIRGFTPLLERMSPEDAILFVNDFLTCIDPAVHANGGFVDSYIGDAVMAVFDRGPSAAIDAGLTIARALKDWTASGTHPGDAPVRIGMGIATGTLVFGTIGAANRLKCGVIGDTVNLASRVEGLTKHYGLDLLITGETHDQLSNHSRYQMREVDFVTVVGRVKPVRLFEVFDGDPEPLRVAKAATAAGLARGHALYRQGRIREALEAYASAEQAFPDDPLLSMLRARCLRESQRLQGQDWSGAEPLMKK